MNHLNLSPQNLIIEQGELKGKGTICNQNITSESIKERSYKVGSVFQDPRSQFFTLHVKTEISFPSENHGVSTDKMQRNISETVDRLKFSPLMGRKPFDLSSGEKQKVALASVYSLGVKVYVLEEDLWESYFLI
ncbi:ATP-binding cassette domain-containing protein [Tissierella sp. DSM 105185]|uniref:ATP-binding cassette domain-containing protein n=1 Tax=Tissierella pigra TaxID=2607614 RepID=A0A6N7XHY3_9FIRM|nr:ATP-binding cassette domain-containing protein [Tissierella pigra]